MSGLPNRYARFIAVGVVAVVGGGLYWLFSVPQAAPSGIVILQANYGANCASFVPPPPPQANNYVAGNATVFVDRMCRGTNSCAVPVDVALLGDPASGCAKDFTVSYLCRQGGEMKTAHLDAEANGKTLRIACTQK